MRLQRRLASLAITGLLLSTLPISAASAASTPDYPGQASMQVGVENQAVKKMQQALIELGYSISVANGKYGPQTTEAVRRFYADNDDSDNGTSLGPIGWREIFAALADQRAAEAAEKEFQDAPEVPIDPNEPVDPNAQAPQTTVANGGVPEKQRGKQPARGASSRSLPYVMPVTGQISAVYNQKGRRWSSRRHTGIDIRAPRGTKIKAVVEGEVIFAARKPAYGRVVVLQHADGTTSWYAHMSKIIAKKGRYLTPGDEIGLVGSSGRSSGSHLHFEVKSSSDKSMNPVTWLQDRAWKVTPVESATN